jgi:uncharacterized protein (TIGR03437 family)
MLKIMALVSRSILTLLPAAAPLCATVPIPVAFEENRGQADDPVRFLAHGSGSVLQLSSREAVLSLANPQAASSNLLRMRWLGGNAAPVLAGSGRQPGITNYLLGKDPRKWQTDIPRYATVTYQGVYRGIDLTFHGAGGRLEYDFVVAPGIDPSVIQLSFSGADTIRSDEAGGLIFRLGDIEVRHRSLVIYQHIDGMRKPVAGRFVLKPGGRVSFQIARHDRRCPLVIDPVLEYSTYVGGSGNEGANAIAVDAAGNVYIAGGSTSYNMLSTGGSGDPPGNAFVAKLNSAGTTVLYMTYFGGSAGEMAWGLAVDAAGNAYVTGSTFSADFPVTSGAAQPAKGDSIERDAFVVKLDPTGSRLLYSTYLGGDEKDVGFNIAVDANGNAYVSGLTVSNDFPKTPGALGANRDRGFFLSKLDATGSHLTYSGILCPYGADFGVGGMAVDPAGNVYVTGSVEGSDVNNYPTTAGAFQTTPPADLSAYVMKVDSSGTGLVYSTFLGGQNGAVGEGIAVDPAGNAVVMGLAMPPPGSTQYTWFVTKMNSTGTALIFSSEYGGAQDWPQKVALDASGNVYVAGWTQSTAFPVTPDALQPRSGGGKDLFLMRIGADGSAAKYATYLGGSQDESLCVLALDPAGNAYLAGSTLSADFPTTAGALQGTYGGASTAHVTNYDGLGDVFVAKIATGESALPQVSIISGASFTRVSALAPGSLASAFGVELSGGTEQALTLPLPTVLSDATVKLTDSSGTEQRASLFFVSPGQINLLIPEGMADGPATLSTFRGDQLSASGTFQIQSVAPGLFSANSNGSGVAAAIAVRVMPDHSQQLEPIYHCSSGVCIADPIDLGPESEQVALELYGTGFRHFSALPQVTVGTQNATVLGAAAQSQYPGLDQVNIWIPRSLIGAGEVNVILWVDGRMSNTVTINVQ